MIYESYVLSLIFLLFVFGNLALLLDCLDYRKYKKDKEEYASVILEQNNDVDR